MSFRIVKSTESLPPKIPVVTIYGEPGIGKTSLSFTAPKPILHFDFDRGINRAVQKIRPDVIKLEKYGEFHNWIMSSAFETYIEEEGYKSVVCDTVGTQLEDFMIPWLISQEPKNGNASGGLTLAGWGALGTSFNQFLKRMQSLGLNVLLVSHAKEEGEEKQMRLAVKGGSSDIVYRVSDMLGYCYIKGNDRVIDFNPRASHIGKNTARLPITVIPDEETEAYDNFVETQVIGKCIEFMEMKSKAQVQYNKDLEEWKSKIEKLDSLDDFDMFVDLVSEIESKVLKVTVKKLLGEKMKEKEVKYSKEEGRFISTKEEKSTPTTQKP